MTAVEGTLDQVLAKARFEEARWRELKMPQEDPVRRTTQHTDRKSSVKPSSPQRTKSNQRCHNCGGVGHFWRDCTVARRALPQESRGTNNGSKRHSNPPPQANKDDKIRGAMTRTLTVQEEQAELVLGPQIEKMVLVDGQEVKALIDTGSPVSIISLRCILQVWKDGRDHGLSEEGRLQRASKALEKDPKIQLRTYDGTPMPLFAEAKVTVTRRNSKHTMAMLVQEEAPQDLLLGTDCLAPLGLELREANPGDGGGNRDTMPTMSGEPDSHQEPATVKLLKPVRIPAGFTKVTTATIARAVKGTVKMLEPSSEFADDDGVLVEPVLVEPDENLAMPVAIINRGRSPVHLEEGKEIGTLESVATMEDTSDSEVSIECTNGLLIVTGSPSLNTEIVIIG